VIEAKRGNQSAPARLPARSRSANGGSIRADLQVKGRSDAAYYPCWIILSVYTDREATLHCVAHEFDQPRDDYVLVDGGARFDSAPLGGGQAIPLADPFLLFSQSLNSPQTYNSGKWACVQLFAGAVDMRFPGNRQMFFDPGEPRWKVEEAGRLGSLVLWRGRKRMAQRVRRIAAGSDVTLAELAAACRDAPVFEPSVESLWEAES